MALAKEKSYLVLNYNTNPVSISTRHDSYLIDGGSNESPSVLPLTIDEIITANSNGYAFKYGLLFFEEEYQEDIYEELRIKDWKNILTNLQIEDIILNPTKEKLEEILLIDNEIYFDRIVGIYTGLKNAGIDISNRVELVISLREKELSEKKRKTEIVLSKNDSLKASPKISEDVDLLKKQNEELMHQMEEMKKIFESQINSNSAEVTKEDEPQKEKETKKSAGRPPKNK
ncbi:hypothetical protein [Anaerovorax sp. IOR16]|uniref:hypothetical protein n=1 Tax=Anaerovorax sp. IOR16 TaxID=2773458 RepID=UPI0019D2A6FC|nr:hypothetical protein [Anaerovorax sp. IOR16]